FTRHIGGRFQKLRLFTGWPFLLGYFLGPWLTWGERQAILFDLPARQFHLFGLTIWPQDLWLLGWLLMIAAFSLFAVTTVVGRLWCGYTCPQTVWTAIFMWAEQITEGERHQRMRLDAVPAGLTRAFAQKLRKRTAKHTMWLGWALLTGVTFVGYFTPIRDIVTNLATADLAALGPWTLFWIVFFTAATYINAGWMREQVCIYMCPYARFQSAMIDKDTLIVSYDPQRGEPRGSRKRGAPAGDLGDCINCQLCVQVCPTGIDIRDGLQYQCIGCAHCVDACDQVMEKMGYAPGLVRYTTERQLHDPGQTHAHWLRPRSIGYALVVLVMTAALVVALWQRSTLAFDVLRERGTLYHVVTQSAEGPVIRNDYQLKIINKSQQTAQYTISVSAPHAAEMLSRDVAEVSPGVVENISLQVAMTAPPVSNLPLEVSLCDTQGHCVRETTRFLAPGGKGENRP
ncbi:MAG: cytochrome c oxidase accessory protein CcoG, partial [Pseudomonadota bacterium]